MQLALQLGVLDLDRGVLYADSGERTLSPNELALVRYLAEADRVVDQSELLEQVWNYSPAARTRTVRVTVSRVRAKLERDPTVPVHLCTETGEGYRWHAEPADAREVSPDLVGRDDALRTLGEALDRGATLVTLVGPAGVGKSRLAAELAALRPGSVCVALGEARDASDVVQRCAMALGGTADGAALESIARTRPVALVVLDDVDAVHDTVAALAEQWSAATLVVTCRAPLRVEGEVRYEVHPLEPGDALQLLTRRWHAERLGAPVDDLPQVLPHLDGLPLAIELAATWAGTLAPHELAARLQESTRWLSDVSGTRPARHRSLEVVLDDMWAALDAGDRALLGELAVFRTDIGLEDAEAVLGHGVLPGLKRLRDRSLLQRRDGRFHVLRSLRDRIEGTASDTTWRAFAEWAHARAVSAGRDLVTLDTQRPDLLAAHGWAATNDPDLAVSLALVLDTLLRDRGPGDTRVAVLRATPPTPPVLARLAQALRRAGDRTEALQVAAQAVDAERTFETLSELAVPLVYRGRADQARPLLLEALQLARAGPPEDIARALQNLAILDRYAGAAERALARYREAFDVPHHDERLRTVLAGNLAEQLAACGRLDEALALVRSVVPGSPAIRAQLRGIEARILHGLGQLPEALAALDEAADLTRGFGWRSVQYRSLAARMLIEGDLGLPEALATADAALELATELGDPGQVRAVQVRRAVLLLAAGRAHASRAVHADVSPEVETDPSATFRCDGLYWLAVAARLRGDADADAQLRRVEDEARALGLPHVTEGLARLRDALSDDPGDDVLSRADTDLVVRLALAT